ncbi:Pentapeptide repeat [Rhodobacterales bacterium HTCC2150]|nr:Pentapeptide repeat [Rhodobacterales bacterium HTCC2150] [Rhodobacteraceae bacterium HTCC2150]
MFDSSGNILISPIWQLIFGFAVFCGLILLLVWQVRTKTQTSEDNLRPELRALKGFAWVLVPLWAGLLILVLYSLFPLIAQFQLEQKPDEVRWLILSIVALITALGGLVSAPLALIRVFTTERQTTTIEQGHITDRINKAVEGLGATKIVNFQRKDAKGNLTYEKLENGENDHSKPVMVTETQPNLEVRIGAIFALERISQDSLRDHVQIMEILTAYIRENTRDLGFTEQQLDEMRHKELESPFKPGIYITISLRDRLPNPSTDIQAAMSVIGRRSKRQINYEKQDRRHNAQRYHLNLSDCNLFKIDLTDMNFERADFSGSNLSFAGLLRTNLQKSIFERTRLTETFMISAQLNEASFSSLFLKGTYLENADLQGAQLSRLHVDEQTQLSGTNFDGALFQFVDLSSSNILASQIEKTFGRKLGTEVPKEIEQPDHWLNGYPLHFDLLKKWRAWQETIGYTPPKK